MFKNKWIASAVFAGLLVASAAAHVRVARCMLFERDRPAPLASAPVPVPDAAPRELAVLVSLAALALLLGVWPVPLLTQIAGGVRDAATSVDPAGADPTMGPR